MENKDRVNRENCEAGAWVLAKNLGLGANVQPYKFGGKEEEKMFGLSQFDFTARTLDVVYGRFNTIDPLAEKYPGMSTYAYCGNNPIMRIDPTGMAWKPTFDEDQDDNRTYNGYEWIPEEQSSDKV